MNDIDLIVSSVTAPLYVTLNETIPVSWTVQNLGTDSTFADWYDTVYISDDQFLDNNDNRLTDDIRENTPLAASGSYTATQNIYIPKYVATGRYLLFVADTYNNQGETNETNNVFAQAITINAPDVDLVVTAANAKTTAAVGENIDVYWTVKNQGTVSALADWYDEVYISDDQFLDDSDTFLDGYNTKENTPLASGGSYTVTKNIYFLPYITPGDRYLLFVANQDKVNGQSETNETNNIFAKAITITAPDLVVTAADAPSTVTLGEVISVSWIVKNLGTGSALAFWDDSVYISDDQFLDNSDTQISGVRGNKGETLPVGGSYTVTQDINLESGTGEVYGQRYLLFVVNSEQYQNETNTTNNVFAKAITVNPPNLPDLVVTATNAPTSAVVGETISLSWTVKNQGKISTSATEWYDSVYISNDQFFDRRDMLVTLSDIELSTPLASGGSYTVTKDITLDTYLIGEQYLLFFTDRLGNQDETNETNNVFAQAITINAPDLVVTAANAPSTATLNQTISVSWTVKNQGTVSALSDWSDAVYISDDQFFDYGDTYIGGGGENTSLAAGDSYTVTQDISLSNVATGDVYDGLRQRYLLFITDGRSEGSRQTETNEANNVFAKAITINAPDVDLVITAANTPSSAVLGEAISVSWTVKNQGTVSTSADWYDTVYISDDQFFDSSDSLIALNYQENTPLAAGLSYTVTQNIFVDSYLAAGDRYLLFITDGGYQGNKQSETNETNNVFAQAITINAPDLVVTAVSAPTTAAVGEIIPVSWTVTNQSTVSALGQWFDTVYFSSDNFLDEDDTQLISLVTQENTFLAPLESYTVTSNVYLGNNIRRQGEGYLLFVTDGRYDQYTDNLLSESNETNNVFAQAITLTPPNVDLVVTATNAPSTATLGETISVSWTVTNQGTGSALRDWYDYVYISRSPTSGSIDIARGNNTPLASGDSYTVTQDISLDSNFTPGDYYLLFVTDVGQKQAETNEYNNIQAVAISLYAQDQIFNGTSGRDTLTGNDSNNLITGLQGADTLTGGAGSDRFVYTSIRDAGDTITDFVAGTDKIDLSKLFQSLSLGSLDYDTATTQGYLSFGTNLSNTTVVIDIDGTAGRARPTPILTVAGVSQSTLAQFYNFQF